MTFPIRFLALTFALAFAVATLAGAQERSRFNDRFAQKRGAAETLNKGKEVQNDRFDRRAQRLDRRTRRLVEGKSARGNLARSKGNKTRTDRNLRKLGKKLKAKAPNTRTATRAARTGIVKSSPRKVTFRLPDGTKAKPGKAVHKSRPKKIAKTKSAPKGVAKAKAPKAAKGFNKKALGKGLAGGLAVGAAATVIGVNVPDPISAATWTVNTLKNPRMAGKRFEKLGKDALNEVGNGVKTLTNPKKLVNNTGKLVTNTARDIGKIVTRPDKAVASVGKGIADTGKAIACIFGCKKK